jgi:hypothetical protein
LASEYQDPLYLDLALNDDNTLYRFITSYTNNEDRIMEFLDRNIAEQGGNFNIYIALDACAERVFNRCIVKILEMYRLPKGDKSFFTDILRIACSSVNEPYTRPLQGNTVAMLIARGADPNDPRFFSSSFYQLCSRGQLEAVQALVTGGLNVFSALIDASAT